MRIGIVFLASALVFSFTASAYGEQSNYRLEVDEHLYDLSYIINADVIAMKIDHELTSLLIGIENTRESQFEIDLPAELISAEENQFAVLVDGFEVDYQIIDDKSAAVTTTLTFFVPEGSQEIEIIGTHVIPEFPLGSLFSLIVLTAMVILVAGFRNPQFR